MRRVRVRACDFKCPHKARGRLSPWDCSCGGSVGEKDTLRLLMQLSVPFRKPSGLDAVRCLGVGRDSNLFRTFVNQKYLASPRYPLETLTLAGIRGQKAWS